MAICRVRRCTGGSIQHSLQLPESETLGGRRFKVRALSCPRAARALLEFTDNGRRQQLSARKPLRTRASVETGLQCDHRWGIFGAGPVEALREAEATELGEREGFASAVPRFLAGFYLRRVFRGRRSQGDCVGNRLSHLLHHVGRLESLAPFRPVPCPDRRILGRALESCS